LLLATTTTRLTAVHAGQPGWAGTRRNIHSLTLCLCGCDTTFLINFLYFVLSTASSLDICWVSQLSSVTSVYKFSLACPMVKPLGRHGVW